MDDLRVRSYDENDFEVQKQPRPKFTDRSAFAKGWVYGFVMVLLVASFGLFLLAF